MKRRWFIEIISVLACAAAYAETTPLTEPLQEEKLITIECELAKPPGLHDAPVFESQKEADACKGIYHYKLWLPAGYLADTQRKWPCMFVAAAGGNARMANMTARLQSDRFIVVMLVESKNGPWPPIIGNFLAAHDDVVKRVRVQEGLKFATGQSGGARASSIFVQLRPGFSGLIMQSAGIAYSTKPGVYASAGIKRNPDLVCCILMGDSDKNKDEESKVRAVLGAQKLRSFEFKGGHQWAPAETFDSAMDWMEEQIYVEGPARPDLRPVYLAYFNTQLEKRRAATAPWEMYKLDNALLDLARSRNLSMEPTLSQTLREAQAEVFKMRLDPVVAKESQAAEALRRVEDERAHTAPATFAGDCLDIVKRYPGTEAATKAQELATP